jgi:gamma-glutamyltranspeptidase / glutathione hydrolase
MLTFLTLSTTQTSMFSLCRQTVLGLVEPQSSGIAGGAFVVYYSASEERLTTFDAREKAPSLATEERFILDGEEMDFNDAWQSALSVGVPGVPMLMQDLHDKYGVLEWSTLFDDAIRIATDGWEQTQRTEDNANELLELNEDCLEPLFFRDLVAADFFLDLNSTDCPMAKPAGTLMTNPAYAATMMALAEGGAAAFYSGEIAEAIVAKVAADRNPTGDAILTFQDLASYEVIEREPLCQPYRDFGEICGMPPPSSGGLALGQIFGILENFELADDPWDVTTIHLFTQAMRLAFADRNL